MPASDLPAWITGWRGGERVVVERPDFFMSCTAAALGLLEVFCLSPTLLNFSSNVTIYLNMLSLPCFTIATNDKQTVRSARVNQLCPDSGA